MIALVTACTSGGSPHRSPTTDSVRIVTEEPPPVGSVEHPRPVECVESVNQPGATTVPTTSPIAKPPSSSSTSASASASASPSGSPTAPSSAKDDVTVGPLTWPGLRALTDGDQKSFGYHDSDGWHYKVAVDLRSGASVTLTIGAEQRAKAGLEYGRAFGSTPTPAVTFNACPARPTVFVGSFFVAGDGRACVPVDVRADGAASRRVVISFFSGPCPAA
ncbi:hypothetical protein [Actinacidiphila alni]|uniref:hypothetical protein n=1 Tax=Actinacidiphila alni TaxID=380248 RepID=UPI001160BF4E|nr:hypothetical protein [Actinacidiphila alni]